jgi:hypothetical protein
MDVIIIWWVWKMKFNEPDGYNVEGFARRVVLYPSEVGSPLGSECYLLFGRKVRFRNFETPFLKRSVWVEELSASKVLRKCFQTDTTCFELSTGRGTWCGDDYATGPDRPCMCNSYSKWEVLTVNYRKLSRPALFHMVVVHPIVFKRLAFYKSHV